MITLRKRLLRGDKTTIPCGIILRQKGEGDNAELVVHYFNRERGSGEPTPGSFFQGSYFRGPDREAKATAEFSRRLIRHQNYPAPVGGSLIHESVEAVVLAEEAES